MPVGLQGEAAVVVPPDVPPPRRLRTSRVVPPRNPKLTRVGDKGSKVPKTNRAVICGVTHQL